MKVPFALEKLHHQKISEEFFQGIGDFPGGTLSVFFPRRHKAKKSSNHEAPAAFRYHCKRLALKMVCLTLGEKRTIAIDSHDLFLNKRIGK